MKFTVKHEKKGRIRVHLFQKYMNFTQADTLQYYLENLDGVKKAQVFNRTSDALIYYTGERNELLKAIQAFWLQPCQRTGPGAGEFRKRIK